MRACSTTLEPEMTTAEQAFLKFLITKHHFTGSHLEVGTAAGGTLCNMMSCFAEQARPRFVVVDRMTYFPDQQQIVLDNLEQHQLTTENVEFRTQTSAAAFQQAEQQDEKFDFMLVDACHKIQAVMSDLRWLRRLNVGGIACFHDYAEKFPGVKLSLDRFLERHPNYERLGLADSLLAIKKNSASRKHEIDFSDTTYSVVMSFPLAVERKMKKWKLRKAA